MAYSHMVVGDRINSPIEVSFEFFNTIRNQINKKMRFPNTIIPLVLLTLLSGCINAGEHRGTGHASQDESSDASDTLVNSFPVNYLAALDTMDASRKLAIRSYKDMLDLFERLHYTPEAWQAGIREVPRVYLTLIGDRWGTTASKEITVEYKKRIFFRGLAPMILRANELIMQDRTRLGKIRTDLLEGTPLSPAEQLWVQKLATLYRVRTSEEPVTASMIEELWERVDIVPASLALAQGAEESGWGTSRFAAEGNAVYGQWTWGKNAIIPEQQRKELGNYGIAAFGSLQESVCAYMLNLNTHNAYAGLRTRRAELRKKGQKITGSVLAEQLTKYSERGEEYVKTLQNMMDYNRLSPADDAYLSDDPPIFLVPAVE